MNGDLRTRIAKVLQSRWSGPTPWDEKDEGAKRMYLSDADAVIRELGLQREQLGADIGYPHPRHRYVTEWIADD